jgi:adenylate cyclase
MRARALAEQLDNASQLFLALDELRVVQLIRAEHEKGGLLAEEQLRLGRETGDPQDLLRALFVMGVRFYWRGEFSLAREYLEEMLGLYDPQKHQGHEYLTSSVNVGVFALSYLSWTLLPLGYSDQALTKAVEALALAREFSHPFSEAAALNGLSRVYLERGDSQASLEMAEALIALSDEHGFPFWLGWGTWRRFQALTEERQLLEGIAGMRSVLKDMRARGAVLGSSWLLAYLAGAHKKAGQVEEGRVVVAEGMAFVAKTGECEYDAEVRRVKAELLVAQSPSDQAEAEALFRDALEIARRQSGKFWELRAATSLARLWQQQGRKKEARELLAPVYDWFTEGFDTSNLKEAKALLDELA